jgi:competence protein ComEC
MKHWYAYHGVIAGCLGYLMGNALMCFLGDQITIDDWGVLCFCMVLCCGVVCFCLLSQRVLGVLCFCLAGICLGAWQYDDYLTDLARVLPYDTRVEVQGVVVAEPDVRTDRTQYVLYDEKHDTRVLVRLPRWPRYAYGDAIVVSCLLRKPEAFDGFRYDMYLLRYKILATCRAYHAERIADNQASIFLKNIYQLKYWVADRVVALWHEPYASFMAGLLYGYRGGLGSLNEQFARTGVTHIVAISGYNITVISLLLMGACSRLYIRRQIAFWIVFFGIIVFVIFAGLSASVVRAGVMGCIVLVARQYGRATQIFAVMVYGAVLMTAYNPLIFMWDAGFQLSFLSTLGLVYLAPKIEPFFLWVPKRAELRESVVGTLAATAATLPLIMTQFGRVSLVSPIVNILILWIIPWAMTVGAFAVLMSIVSLPMGRIVGMGGYLMLRYVTKVVAWWSQQPFAAIDVAISWWWSIGLTIVLIWFGWPRNFKKKKN